MSPLQDPTSTHKFYVFHWYIIFQSEFEDQMNQVKEGVPLNSLPPLPVPRPPPPPDANIVSKDN